MQWAIWPLTGFKTYSKTYIIQQYLISLGTGCISTLYYRPNALGIYHSRNDTNMQRSTHPYLLLL